MTDPEVIAEYKYRFGGLVMDAARNRTGQATAMAVDHSFEKIEQWLGEICRLLRPPADPPLPVKPAPPPVKPAGNPPPGQQPGGPRPGPGPQPR